MKTPKLSDKDEVEIRAAYAEGGVTYASLGKKYGVSPKTIERVIRRDTMEVAQKVTDIKKQNAVDVTEYIRSRSGEAMELFDDTLAQLRRKLPTASVRELFGGLKIISEIFSPQADVNSGAGAEPVKINVVFGDTSGTDKPSDGINAEEAQSYAE